MHTNIRYKFLVQIQWKKGRVAERERELKKKTVLDSDWSSEEKNNNQKCYTTDLHTPGHVERKKCWAELYS